MGKATLVAGLGFGDEGKGTMTQYLAKESDASLVVRYNGGAQAAHNVYTADGKHHTFAQFGAATFEGVRTHLSKFVVVEPFAIIKEGRDLQRLGFNSFPLLTIDSRALLISQYHWSANRLREFFRTEKHGTCGRGVGEAVVDAMSATNDVPRMGDIADPVALLRTLKEVQERKYEEFKGLLSSVPKDDLMERAVKFLLQPANEVVEHYQGLTSVLQIVGPGFLSTEVGLANMVFEGAQGVLLDQDYGFQPHTTWSNTTFGNALSLLEEAGFHGDLWKVGVTRSFMSRHGHGPLPTEEARDVVLDKHNSLNLWQGDFRVGRLDLVLLRYALDVIGGVDEIAMTHIDWWKEFAGDYCNAYVVREDDKHLFDDAPLETNIIIRSSPVSYERQREITTALSRVDPVHSYCSTIEPEDFLATVCQRLKTPIGILSNSPLPHGKVRV